MQKIIFSLFFIGTSAMAAPIFCGSRTSPYRLQVSNDHKSAVLTIKNKIPQFGRLTCRSEQGLYCHSPHVADAGYGASFRAKAGTTDLLVEVETFWIGGTRPLVTLPCVAAMNHN